MTINNKKITVLTTCKDRESNLNKMRKNITKLNHISEHIIIDWSSSELISIENEINTRIISKSNEEFYWASRAYNFGVNYVNTDYVLKLDAETLIDYKKFNEIDYLSYDLIILYKQRYDPGNFLISKHLFEKVNGFNEFLFGWGWEDHDLINRLKMVVHKSKILETDNLIDKIEHKDSDRVQIGNFKLESKYNDKIKYSYAVKKGFNQTNSYISNLNIWKNQSREYTLSDNKIHHFYTIKNLNMILRYKHKFYFFKTLFMVLNPSRKIYRRFAPIIYSLCSESRIYNLFGINIYPKK